MKDFFKLKQEIDAVSSITEKYKNTELQASPKPRDAHKANPSDSIRDQEVEKDKEVKKAKKPSETKATAEEKLDPVDKKALKKDFDDRKDKDIDNDGDVDASDEYLHNRRKTIGKAMRKDKKEEQVTKEDLEKEPDGPCWEGYVQVGTKMVDGKEVPNCVPMEEARNRMKNEQTSYEDDIDPNKKIVVKGTKGMNSKSFTKKFRNMKAADKWMDDNEGDVEIKQVMNESTLAESYHDVSDYGSAGASDMAITQMYFIKYAALEVIECLKAGVVMPEWYQNKIAKLEGDMEGIHSYMEGKKMRMKHAEHDRMKSRYMPGMGMGHGMYEQTLTEATTVEVSVRDARKANDVAKDMFRGEYKNDGSNAFMFKDSRAADDFMTELQKQGLEVELAESKKLTEKAESEAQQKAAAVALAVKRGDQPESVLQGASRDMYDSMSADELEDFAKTKHSGIPAKKD